ncbi:Rsm22-cox11 tandem protein 1, mitochondrial [Smittium mucronatum]|nr:Rsm22-cox11 tandem protein 1, mitochondrial [Smittium mucronatum]
MKSKHAKINEEDLKYSYLVIRKGPRPTKPRQDVSNIPTSDPSPKSEYRSNEPRTTAGSDHNSSDEGLSNNTTESYSWPRVLLPAMKRSGHVVVDVCSESGETERKVYTKSMSNQSYRDARKVQWGDLFPHVAKTTTVRKIGYKPYV